MFKGQKLREKGKEGAALICKKKGKYFWAENRQENLSLVRQGLKQKGNVLGTVLGI